MASICQSHTKRWHLTITLVIDCALSDMTLARDQLLHPQKEDCSHAGCEVPDKVPLGSNVTAVPVPLVEIVSGKWVARLRQAALNVHLSQGRLLSVTIPYHTLSQYRLFLNATHWRKRKERRMKGSKQRLFNAYVKFGRVLDRVLDRRSSTTTIPTPN